MTIEELTDENLKLKEQLQAMSVQLSDAEAQVEGLQNTVIDLRTKNANLYNQIGKTYDTEPELDELSSKEKFINEYIRSKTTREVL